MNLDDALDTVAAPPPAPINWVKSFLIPLAVATIAGTVSLGVAARLFTGGNKSTQLQVEQIRTDSAKELVVGQKLIAAYNAFSTITPAGSTIGSLTNDEKRSLEYGMRDVYLYGNSDVTKAVDKWFKSNFKTPVEGVLFPLRNQIRSLSGLTPSKQMNSPWIQTFWRSDPPRSSSSSVPVPTTKAN
jgi:hypothetical protein